MTARSNRTGYDELGLSLRRRDFNPVLYVKKKKKKKFFFFFDSSNRKLKNLAVYVECQMNNSDDEKEKQGDNNYKDLVTKV